MPVSRGYGSAGGATGRAGSSGYTPSYSPSHFSLYSPSSSYSTYRSTSSGGSRSGTPNRSIGPGSSTNSSSQLRNYVFNSSGTPAAYKYFSRSEFYNSTAIYNRNINADNTKLKTVKTDDLDVNQPKDRQREHAIPGQIKRDTAANIAGGKQVIRLVTTKLKSNPYNTIGLSPDQMTLGQKLASKHLINEPKSRPSSTLNRQSSASEGESSDWTWETCSDSDPEGVDTDSISTTSKTTTTTSTSVKTTKEVEKPPVVAATNAPTAAVRSPSTFKIDAHTAKWLNYKVDKPSEEQMAKEKAVTKPTTRDSRYPSMTSTAKSTSSSDSSASPVLTRKVIRSYMGAGSKTLHLDSSEGESEAEAETTSPELNIGWRKGQPPRSDVVVKFTKEKNQKLLGKPSGGLNMPKPTAAERVANKILVGPIHKIPKTEPNLPPLKFGQQKLTERVFLEDFKPLYQNKRSSMHLETIEEASITPNLIDKKALISCINVNKAPKMEVATELVEKYDEEVAQLIKDFVPPQLQIESRNTPNLLSDLNEVTNIKVESQVAPKPNPFITPKLAFAKPPDVVSYGEQDQNKRAERDRKFRQEELERADRRRKEDEERARFVEQERAKRLQAEEIEKQRLIEVERAKRAEQAKLAEIERAKQAEQARNEALERAKRAEKAKLEELEKIKRLKAEEMERAKRAELQENQRLLELERAKQLEKQRLKEQERAKRAQEEAERAKRAQEEAERAKRAQQEAERAKRAKEEAEREKLKREQERAKRAEEQRQAELRMEEERIAEKERAEREKQARYEKAKNVVKKEAKIVEQPKLDPPKFVQAVPNPMDPPVQVEHKPKTEKGAKKKCPSESKPKVAKKVKKEAKTGLPDLVKSAQESMTSEEKLNELIANNQIIPKEVLQDIIKENDNLPNEVIAEIPIVKAAIEYNFKHEDDIIASQLERIPTPFRKFYEAKNKGVYEDRQVPEDKPKYWNNAPKEDSNNPFLEMAKLRSDVKKHKEEQKLAQKSLEANTEMEPEEAWYKDESEEFQKNLKEYHHRESDHQRPLNERHTPAENMAVIKIYGGIQFPHTQMDETPGQFLKLDEESASLMDHCGAKPKRESLCNFNEPPVKTRPNFRKYGINDFGFLKVLGKGSFGKVLLAELLDGSQSYYAIKCLKKDLVLEDDDIECTMIERKVLALGCKHPFICHLFCTFQTTSHLFFAMEYLNGGDLMFHIQQSGKFDLERAKFYSAEILLALKFLHRKGIVYRDLKLDNVLLDFEGHVRLADFGMCKLQIYLDRVTDTFCGTPDYMAPEIIKGLKYNYLVDWWSFGVLLYEMLLGQSPFNGCDEDELFWSICNETVFFPKFLTKESKHLIQLLLEKDPSRRLGLRGSPEGDIADQPFFKNVNFQKLERKQVTPPFRPNLLNAKDVSYFDSAFTEDDPLLTPLPREFLDGVNQDQFKGFSYTDPNYTLPAI